MAAQDPDALRECIRRLVGVIRQSSLGESPVESDQLEHIKKVIRVLSLSEEQIDSMGEVERAQVLNIRKNALSKMRLANTVRSSERPSGTSASSSGSSPGHLSPSSAGGCSPASSFGSAGPTPFSSFAATANHPQMQAQAQGAVISGPMPVPMQTVRNAEQWRPTGSHEPFRPAGSTLRPSSTGGFSTEMPPPSFYVRKTSERASF